MTFAELEIYIDRRPHDPECLRARVMQQSADGAIFGKDILSRIYIDHTNPDRACFKALDKFRLTRAAEKLTFIFDPLLKREPVTIRVL